MSLIKAAFGEAVSLSENDSWLVRAIAPRTFAGVAVSPNNALSLSAVFACIRVLAETFASLPLSVYQDKGNGESEEVFGHPLKQLFNRKANAHMTSFRVREALMGHLGGWGNAYAEIEKDAGGRVVGLWPLPPDATTVYKDPDTLEVFYRTIINGKSIILRSDQVLHVPGLGYDGYVGYSPIGLARQAIGLGLAMEEFGARLFSQGSSSGVVIEHPQKLSPDAVRGIKKAWVEQEAGLDNAHGPRVLGEGAKLNHIGIPPEDAQFLESRKYQTNEIARFYRMPLHKIQEMSDQKYANIEQENTNFATDTIAPWTVRWQQEINVKLFTLEEQKDHYVKFNLNALMRGDANARSNYYRSGILSGWLTRNEVRALEEYNSIEGLDEPLIPANMNESMDTTSDERKTDSAP